MPLLHAFTSLTPTSGVYGRGILMVGTTIIGISDDDYEFNANVEMRTQPIPGFMAKVRGQDRPIRANPTIGGSFKQLSNVDIQRLQLNGVFSGTAPLQVLTMPKGNQFLTASEYQTDVRLLVNRMDGKLCVAHLPIALLLPGAFRTANEAEGSWSGTFEGRVDPTLSNAEDNYGFRTEIRDAIPTA